MPVTTILELMKKQRHEEDTKVAELARVEYGEQFTRLFSYRVGGKQEVQTLVQPHAIARRYRQLQPPAQP